MTQQDLELKLMVLLLTLEKKLMLILLLLKLLLLERIWHNWDLIKATTTTPYKTLLNHTTWPNTWNTCSSTRSPNTQTIVRNRNPVNTIGVV